MHMTPAWTIGVRELRNGEDAPCMLFCPLLLIDRFYEAEIILFRRDLMATRLERTCWAMLVEDHRGRCSAGLLRSKLSNIRLSLVHQLWQAHGCGRIVWPMNDLRDGGKAAGQAGQGKRIKSDGQLVEPGQ